jgi:anti-sigma regulatory factor (Ser/Thr protein kinase)
MIELTCLAESVHPGLLLIDTAQLNQTTAAWLLRLMQQLPACRLVLLARAGEFAAAAQWAQRLKVQVIYPLHGWRVAGDWSLWRAWMEKGGADAALERSIGPDGECATWTVLERGSTALACAEWRDFVDRLALPGERAYDLALCAEELVNNAFIHAYDGATGHQTARSKSAPNQRLIEMSVSAGGAWFGFRVRDGAGRLVHYRALAGLARQWGAQGVMDEQGRGLYLAHTLASRLIINVRAGVLTEVTLLFAREATATGATQRFCPIAIFESSESAPNDRRSEP